MDRRSAAGGDAGGTGATGMFACRSDSRYAYTLYVPRGGLRCVLVVVHGSRRAFRECRDLHAEFAERHGCVIVAPLFPAGLHVPGDGDGYKFLRDGGVRCDLLLLDMVDEVAARYGVPAARFLLSGFSGGGQFAHRFFYLHPRRLAAVSIGAPGAVTLPDPGRPWWSGISDATRIFGLPVDVGALRAVPVHLVVGAEDLGTERIMRKPEDRYWVEGANDAGATRIERLEALGRSLRANGVSVRHEIVPGVGHSFLGVVGRCCDFFDDVLRKKREEESC
ncbi:MAG: alpha/beta hydrolase [Burkholderiales bacterium]|nr:alpha/beta hydrolase [Burkholderiales bacterium]